MKKKKFYRIKRWIPLAEFPYTYIDEEEVKKEVEYLRKHYPKNRYEIESTKCANLFYEEWKKENRIPPLHQLEDGDE